jgi:hypothetical protein
MIYNTAFFQKNFITSASQITNTGSAVSDVGKLRLFDRNKDVEFIMAFAGSDTDYITWTPAASVTVDTIFIQNHNLKKFQLEYYSGGTWHSISGGNYGAVANTTDSSHFFYFPDMTATVWRLWVRELKTGETSIKIAEMYIGLSLFFFDTSVSGSWPTITPITEQKLFTLSDGTTHRELIRSLEKYSIQFQNVRATDRQNLVNLVNTNRRNAFVCVPFPATPETDDDGNAPGSSNPASIWDGNGMHCNWVNGHDYNRLTTGYNVDGYDVVIDRKSVV